MRKINDSQPPNLQTLPTQQTTQTNPASNTAGEGNGVIQSGGLCIVAETLRRRRIRQAVESRGYQIKEITWEHWHNAGEKSGMGGGWTVIVDRPYIENSVPGDDLFGLSVEEVLADIDYWLKPPELCSCDLNHSANRPLIDDPQKPTHSPDCRWHISYKLPWWKH